jgi:hypothetical protein
MNRMLNAESDPVQTVAVPITAVIKYDIPNLKIEMNDEYNFMEDMLEQLGPSAHSHHIDLDGLAHLVPLSLARPHSTWPR